MTSYTPVPGVGPETPADHDYEGGFAAALMLKDLKLAMDAAQSVGAYTPMGARGRGTVPALRRPRRRHQGFLRHHQDDRRQLESARQAIGDACASRSDCRRRSRLLRCGCRQQARPTTRPQSQRSRSGATPRRRTNAVLGRRAGQRRAGARRSCTSGTKAWKTIGKANKALNRELDAGSPDLAAIRAPRRPIADLSRKVVGLVPAGHRPRRRQDRRQARNLAEPARFRRQARAFQKAAQAFNAAAESGDVDAIKAQLRRPRQSLQGLPRQVSRGDAPLSEPAASKQPVWDLPTRLFHWLLVALIAFSWWSVENHHTDWHIWSGIAILTLLIFRLLWGFVGSSTARFASFVRGPRAVLDYLRGSWTRDRPHAARRAQRRRLARRDRGPGRARPVLPGRGRPLRGPARRPGQHRHSDEARDLHETCSTCCSRSSSCTSPRSSSTACAGRSLTKPMITGRAELDPGARADAARQMVGRAALPRRRLRRSPAGSSPARRRSALDRDGPRDHIARHADPHRTDAQPRDPQVPSRPDGDGGRHARLPRRRVAPRPRRSPRPCSPAAWSKASSSAATSSR